MQKVPPLPPPPQARARIKTGDMGRVGGVALKFFGIDGNACFKCLWCF